MRKVFLAVLLITMLVVTSAAAAQDKITITIWHTYNEVSPENDMLTKTLIPEFEQQNPDITVNAVPYPYDGFRQALLTALAGGTGPDLARLDIIWSPEFANQGVLAQLDTVMPDFKTFADAVFPGPLATNAYNGHYYGLPLDTNTRVLLYSPDTLKTAGIDAPPATIDDVKADCEKVKALNNGTFLFSDGGTSGWNLLPWIWSMGGDITDANYTKATGYLNSAKTVATYQFLADMIKSGCFTDGMTGSGIDTGAGFFGGTILTELDGPWTFPTAQSQYPDFKLTPTLMPAGDGGSISVVGGENIVMFNTTPNQDAALKFLRFTQSADYQQKMSTIGQLTVQPALVATDYFKNHPYYPVFLKQLATAKPRTPVPQWNAMEEILSDAGQTILRGESSAQDALDAAASQIDALLAEQVTPEAVGTAAS